MEMMHSIAEWLGHPYVVWGCLMTAGLAMLGYAVFAWMKTRDMKTWPRAEGVITVSGVEGHWSKSNGQSVYMYSHEVCFDYTVDDRSYSSDNFSMMETSSSLESWAKKRAAKYPVGKNVRPLYNPSDPSEAYLETTGNWVGVLGSGVVGSLLFVVGLLGALGRIELG